MNSILVESQELSYISVLENWDIAPHNLKLLGKKLGGGRFGIVKQGLLTTKEGEPQVVAVKTVKGNVTPGCGVQESQGLQLAKMKFELNNSSQCTIIPNLFPR